ncbi:hypothetical protein KBD71_00125 [Candidatus Woesebacteria bacterium]|nr:hypothetical protein [Candidatus Woesebacteria bacterium]
MKSVNNASQRRFIMGIVALSLFVVVGLCALLVQSAFTPRSLDNRTYATSNR